MTFRERERESSAERRLRPLSPPGTRAPRGARTGDAGAGPGPAPAVHTQRHIAAAAARYPSPARPFPPSLCLPADGLLAPQAFAILFHASG